MRQERSSLNCSAKDSSNYAAVVMGVFMPVCSMYNQIKNKLFCDEIINIYQIVKTKREITA